MPNEKFRVYDAEIAQWLTPDWENVVSPNGNELVSPFQLFPYRFINNDPINAKHPYHHDAMGKFKLILKNCKQNLEHLIHTTSIQYFIL